jgi:hypothetical protein
MFVISSLSRLFAEYETDTNLLNDINNQLSIQTVTTKDNKT